MLDATSTFDAIVTREARDPDQAARILHNVFYKNIASALGGTQEYMAIEKLHEMYTSDQYDLIIVDTPPSRHALAVLDAPHRLVRLLENPIIRAMLLPQHTPLRVLSHAMQSVARRMARIIGAEVIDDVVAFFRAIDDLEAGFRRRARDVSALLASPACGYVLVTTPQPEPVRETQTFAARLAELQHPVDCIIVNRSLEPIGSTLSAALDERSAAIALHASIATEESAASRAAATVVAQRLHVLADHQREAEQQAQVRAELLIAFPTVAIQRVASTTAEVTDIGPLVALADELMAPQTPSSQQSAD
jgi:anion-transporting  ArsA/GET3 family ATPase